VPKFLVGHSLGGLISLEVADQIGDQLNGISLVTPFLNFYDEKEIEKAVGLCKMLNYVIPAYQITAPRPKEFKVLNWFKHWQDDPLDLAKKMTAHTTLELIKARDQLREKTLKEAKTPFLMVLGGKENMTDNKAAKQFFETSEITDKDLVEYADMGHLAF